MADRQLPAALLLWLLTLAVNMVPEPTVRAQAVEGEAAAEIDFARDIRPLLSDRCFLCHGPDANQRATELRLDVQASAHAIAIEPGQADESEMIRRIVSTDAELRMPPPDSNLQLSEKEQELLRRWIDAGGRYDAHWAFIPPERPPLPTTKLSAWPRNPIDHFVLARLERQRLLPSRPADPESLIRRVSFDLTGLPPTPAEVDGFLAEFEHDAEAAYVTLVDRLLASPRLGERLAVDWLDIARYADTYGYQNDRYRATWPWRDWVVRAFNENLGYDQFITQQLAGDLLPAASRDQILATAFNRHHRQTNEGGSVEEEFRSEYVADRVNTFGAAFLGLTLECCRCHDHKYDPLTQRDYYQLSAFFNSIDESGLYSHFTEATPTPTLWLSSAEQEQSLAEINAAIAERELELGQWQPTFQNFEGWQDLLRRTRREALIGDYGLDELQEGKLRNRVDDELTGQTSEDPQLVPGRIGQALLLSGENNVSLPTGGDFTRNQPFTIAVWLKAPRKFSRAVVFHRSRAWTDSGSRGYELLIEEGKLSAGLIHFWPGNALRVVSLRPLAIDEWTHVAVRYDGSSSAAGLQLFVNGELEPSEVVRDSLTKNIHGADGLGGGDSHELTFGQRFRDVGFKDGLIDEIKVFNRDLSPLELRDLVHSESQSAATDEGLAQLSSSSQFEAELRESYRRQQPEFQSLARSLRELRDRRSELGDHIAEIMVMREQPEPRPTYILQRGAYDAPGELVQRGVPQTLFPWSLPNRPSRLDLAQWLIAPENPLTARVAVNRLWQGLFGTGLVSTAEDFGLQGAAPTHPALLDWLSVELVQAGWDVKHLLRLFVTSATYRQSSDAKPQLRQQDPDNQWLARGPVVRLPAEMIRDLALLAGGLLDETQGGAPVKPYQPDGLWEEKSGLKYVRDKQAGSHRRSLYTYWKRTSPPPNMMTLDASNREVCAVRRPVTMTPLQLLVLLNDPQFVEAARALATRSLLSTQSTEECATNIYRSLTGTRPTPEQLKILLSMHERQRALFNGAESAHSEWLSIGDQPVPNAVNSLDLAAWSVVAGGLMSLDQTVMKR